SVKDDIAAVVLQDQVDALLALAGDFPLDLDLVAIRGWSIGGYLAPLAALRRPDVFHAALLGARATAPTLFSIAMMDAVCPPSTCFAAYHLYGGAKDLRVYEFNGHEGGAGHHRREQLIWLRGLFRVPGLDDPGIST
ncbi:acetylxylan esterase, partial [Streptomyces sp. DH12]|uniref:acetylxylan esterase n=1 Tax=Streptomyces sp. DH12 TaxID=2857010 RepID=UPI001E4550F7